MLSNEDLIPCIPGKCTVKKECVIAFIKVVRRFPSCERGNILRYRETQKVLVKVTLSGDVSRQKMRGYENIENDFQTFIGQSLLKNFTRTHL